MKKHTILTIYQGRLFLIIRAAYTVFLIFLVPVYAYYNGLQNFLWISDVSLFLTLGALWLESPLLISVLCIGILPFEVAWNIDFIMHICGYPVFDITAYMFDAHKPLFVRLLSLFHVFLPLMWIWYLMQWGYDRRAPLYASVLVCATLLLTYFLTDPVKNINWVFVPMKYGIPVLPEVWLTFLLLGIPVGICWPLHAMLKKSGK